MSGLMGATPGPSKFIGYQNLTAADILSDAEHDRDGRRTEAQLKQWFTTVDTSSPLYDKLNEGLVELLARFGKTPSTKMRVNVLHEVLEQYGQPNSHGAIVDLIVAVAKLLPANRRDVLQARLAA